MKSKMRMQERKNNESKNVAIVLYIYRLALHFERNAHYQIVWWNGGAIGDWRLLPLLLFFTFLMQGLYCFFCSGCFFFISSWMTMNEPCSDCVCCLFTTFRPISCHNTSGVQCFFLFIFRRYLVVMVSRRFKNWQLVTAYNRSFW